MLTAYDGQSITYDASGNPTSYYNGTRWTFGWAEGRNLVSASGGGHSVTYAYDHNGVRTTKTVDGVVHTYYYASGKLLRETYGSNTLDFFYDASGTPFALRHNSTMYYYITNLQGDVMQLVNASGAVVASYEYDPYGNIISATGSMATTNPLRYRGYYYDSETELYYLQSRYYDPQIGRFINADAYPSTGQDLTGNNMFAYCGNNPVARADNGGEFWHLVVGGVIVGIIGAVSSAVGGGDVTDILIGASWRWNKSFISKILLVFSPNMPEPRFSLNENRGSLTDARSRWLCFAPKCMFIETRPFAVSAEIWKIYLNWRRSVARI